MLCKYKAAQKIAKMGTANELDRYFNISLVRLPRCFS